MEISWLRCRRRRPHQRRRAAIGLPTAVKMLPLSLSLSHSLAFPCIRNTVLRIRGAVLTQFSDTIQRRGAIWTGHRSRNAVNRGDVKIVLQRLIAPLDRSECGLTSSRKYNSCRRTRRGRN